MKARKLHPWKVTPGQAIQIQNRLRDQVVTRDGFKKVRCIAGCDIGFKGEMGQAAIVVMSFPHLKILDYVVARKKLTMPYIPGLLSFREIPVLISAFRKLKTEPDLIIADGQGIAHPRKMGIGAHLGLLLDKPVIGCAKSRLCGTYREPAGKKGSRSYLYNNGEVIGSVLRTRDLVSCAYVSLGHKISLKSAVNYVLRCCTHYRLPEPIRMAHQIAGGYRP